MTEPVKAGWAKQDPPEGVQTAPPPPPMNIGDATMSQETPPAPASPPDVKEEFAGLPVRTGGDQIFILKGGKKHWVTSPEAFAKAGFKFGDESEIDRLTLGIIPEGEPLK